MAVQNDLQLHTENITINSSTEIPTGVSTNSPIGETYILDGATPDIQCLDQILVEQILQVPTEPENINKKIDMFRNIIDASVGDTSLNRSRSLERETGIRNLYLKFEGGNPTGTHKDRIAFAQAQDALRRGYDAVTLATCGNYGVAMALACHFAGIQCHIYIPEGYHTKRIVEMKKYGAHINFAGQDYERACLASQLRATTEGMYDANPGGSNSVLQMEAYAEIAYEIYDELRDAPAVVALPVSNGTALAGIYLGFLRLYRKSRTSRMPKMIAGSAYKKNPIIHSFLHKDQTCVDLQPEKIRETIVNEPLINWHSTDGNEALQAIYNSNGSAQYVSDKAMKIMSKKLRDNEGLLVLPASTAGLLALLQEHKKQALPGDRYVAVLTGKQG